MNKINVNGFQRITKAKARKIYEKETDVIYMCPVNLRPGEPFCPEIAFYKTGENFDKLVNAFEFYNCTNNETGKYAAYYTYDFSKERM